ncbi:glycosyltransferase family 2 protein [Herbaspirillum sp. RTI4]|uniref:glycosyltransferase family 2 protein n=1 Tax=Herbaspirillum sp. RTI4 TaxID=3048640 RepID=UPI002AB4CA12|nr:glycosyltransferase family 2 protein [Herbaspirillum sp. RTI4]MDY7578264.1 glycosyltransferase family 2 protein [Herbaspirillum sp. RTI4]MEA9981243.1 glycosyltransferase family 2 protein [Herbaspirillum sp. RTI4]
MNLHAETPAAIPVAIPALISADIDISICICTFRRPLQLTHLLVALLAQAYDDLRIEVVVVDNDPAGSAATVLEHWRQCSPLPLQARHEPTPNISLARNAAVHAASGAWILFIDDDELPDPDWIRRMVATQAQYQADAVLGPVTPNYRSDTPDWIRRGDFFNRRRLATGTRVGINDARTGNVLIRRSLLQQLPGPFDPAFGLSGAEDTLLFHALIDLGAVLIWCDEATVSEEVASQRATLGWLLRRSYRQGQTYMRCELVRRRGAARCLRGALLGLRALLQCAIALVCSLLCLPLSPVKAVKWLRIGLSQCGKLSALAGHRYHEYGR